MTKQPFQNVVYGGKFSKNRGVFKLVIQTVELDIIFNNKQ